MEFILKNPTLLLGVVVLFAILVALWHPLAATCAD